MKKTISNYSKRIWAVLLVSVMMFSVLSLTGCDNANNSSTMDITSGAVETTKLGEGEKTFTLEVVHKDGTVKAYEIKTDEEFLRGALEEHELITGSESEYGMFVTAVNGEEANSSENGWWCLTKGEALWEKGIDTSPIEDGDRFEFTYTIGY